MIEVPMCQKPGCPNVAVAEVTFRREGDGATITQAFLCLAHAREVEGNRATLSDPWRTFSDPAFIRGMKAARCRQRRAAQGVVSIPRGGRLSRLRRLFREGFRSAARPRVFLAAATIGLITSLLDLPFSAAILALVALAYGAAYCDPKETA